MSVSTVFNAAKEAFGWASDQATFHQCEYWATTEEMLAAAVDGKVRGDCDDFAELCVHQLRIEGYPARFVLCLTESGEAHLVCEVEGMILDNRQAYPTPIDRLEKYTWLACSGEQPGEPWRRIESIA